MTQLVFIPEFKFGVAALATAELVQETNEFYQHGYPDFVFGPIIQLGRGVRKGYHGVSLSKTEALQWLEEKAKEYVRECELVVTEAKERLILLEQMILESQGETNENQ